MGYKWKKVQKGVFFDGHESEDVIKCRETFLNKMKSLLSCFVEFFEDGIMVPKEYPDDCTVRGLDQRPTLRSYMMKIHFPSMMGSKKYRLLIVKVFYGLKEKEKRLWYQIFYFHSQSLTCYSYSLNKKKT